MTATAVKCRTKGCPFTPDEHDEWMALCRQAPEHGHRDDQLSHQHHPKKGMGGHNSLSKIVAILCWPMHNRIDNGDYGNDVKDGVFSAWDLHGKTLIERPVLSAAAEAAEAGQDTQDEPVSPSVQVPVPDAGSSAAAPSAGQNISPPTSPRRRAPVGGSTSSTGRASNQHIDDTTPLTHEQRAAIAAGIKEMEWGRQWLAGDTANEWEEELGEDFWNEWANEFGYTYPSLRNNQRVCAAVPPPFRHEMLRFSHHVVVADLNREDMDMWMEKCAAEGWSVAEFRRQVKGERPRVKRYSVDELRALLRELADAVNPSPLASVFLDSLGEQA